METTRLMQWLVAVAAPLAYASLGIVLAAIGGFIFYLNRASDLEKWHETSLELEFTKDSGVTSLNQYLKLEAQLFEELQTRIIDKVPSAKHSPLNRFTPASESDPAGFSRNWNRSFELPGADDGPAILLLHGMSDSPYSMRGIALELNQSGAHVLGLRLPGHGTAPSGLTSVHWQDMAAAVDLAVRHLRDVASKRPVYLVGYSNGGALSVEYALRAALDEKLPSVQGLVLLSPAIGITPAASLAIWQERLGSLLGLAKLKWNTVLPEYDPYKYQSFAVNAGDQSYRLTGRIAELLARASKENKLKRIAPALIFQSAVDATVSTSAVIEQFLNHLPQAGHELVVFDINRRIATAKLFGDDPMLPLRELTGTAKQSYAINVVTNATRTSTQVVEKRWAASGAQEQISPLQEEWPSEVFSLSHVALPFAPSDPLYGNGEVMDPTEKRSLLAIGSQSLRGERGVLLVPPGDLIRQRHNPFHGYMMAKIRQAMQLPGDAAAQ